MYSARVLERIRMRILLSLIVWLAAAAGVFAQQDCVFCQIAKGDREASLVYRGDRVVAFMDHAPVNPGHVLIIPAAHAETLLDLPPETAKEMMALAQKVGAAIKATDLKADSFQLQMNSGQMVQRLPHALLHIWPRFRGDLKRSGLDPLGGERARAPREELDAAARKIKTALDLGTLYEEYYEESLPLFSWQATIAGDHRYDHVFPNFLSSDYRQKLKEFFGKYLARLKEFDRNALSPAAQADYDTLAWICENELDELKFPRHLLPINQMSSPHLAVPIWAGGTSAQPFKTVRDYENWLKRLDGFAEWCGDAVDRMREGISKGYVLPKALTEKVIPQLAKMTTGAVEEHLFYRPIQNIPGGIGDADRERLARAYADIIRHKIIPAYATLQAFMINEYLPVSRTTSGISDIPDGAEFYKLQVKTYTTTEMTADEIHELGKREVERILNEMEAVKRQVGFQGNIKEFLDHVRTKKELLPFSEPQAVIENFNLIHKRMEPALDRLFDLVPKTPFEVRRTEAFREKSAAAQYMSGTLDGSRPGIFYVPIPDINEYNVMSDEALFLHEAIPGHHYQIALQRENSRLPMFRRTQTFSATAEGWALYCESLGKELGLYTDPYQYLGMLSMEIHRAIRLVVDTGIHAKGWTREQAIAYSLEREAETESGIISEIERYMAWPGQALAYKIGQLKIRELRARAEKELGDKFNIREFHNQILEVGSVPLKVLEAKVIRWIETSPR
jgi:uncharacterized protein (DUF885 family)